VGNFDEGKFGFQWTGRWSEKALWAEFRSKGEQRVVTLNSNVFGRNTGTSARHDEIKELSRTDAPLYKPTLCILGEET
jgi:hypothetical protein